MITPTQAHNTYTLGEPMLVADAVIDLANRHPDSFAMEEWHGEYDDPDPDKCGTTACIAGWVGILHEDTHANNMRMTQIMPIDDANAVMDRWQERQAHRIGLTANAGNILFRIMNDEVAIDTLTSISKWHTHNTGRIDEDTMITMAAESYGIPADGVTYKLGSGIIPAPQELGF